MKKKFKIRFHLRRWEVKSDDGRYWYVLADGGSCIRRTTDRKGRTYCHNRRGNLMGNYQHENKEEMGTILPQVKSVGINYEKTK